MLTLIENAEVYAPEPRGRQSVLVVNGTIGIVGAVDGAALARLDLDVTTCDATGCVLIPGLIDPHEHLLGGSGEEGFSTQTPEVTLSEIVTAGITTVVGTLGVDTTMKTMAGLLARVKGLKEEGLSAFVWSGGYNVPAVSISGSIRSDLMFIEEVIGAGEVAIADHRGLCPQPPELAKLVLDTHVGGMLSGKAGVTHFHVGAHEQRLKRLRELLDGDFAVTGEMLYPTHITRSEQLMDEAIALATRGAHVDIDTVEGDLARWLRYYLDHGGDPNKLTVSSDTGTSHPGKLFEELRGSVTDHGFALETVLPFVTCNTASVLKFKTKGCVAPGYDGDLVVLDAPDLRVRDVFARGRAMVRDGALVQPEGFLETMTRSIHLQGTKT